MYSARLGRCCVELHRGNVFRALSLLSLVIARLCSKLARNSSFKDEKIRFQTKWYEKVQRPGAPFLKKGPLQLQNGGRYWGPSIKSWKRCENEHPRGLRTSVERRSQEDKFQKSPFLPSLILSWNNEIVLFSGWNNGITESFLGSKNGLRNTPLLLLFPLPPIFWLYGCGWFQDKRFSQRRSLFSVSNKYSLSP